MSIVVTAASIAAGGVGGALLAQQATVSGNTLVPLALVVGCIGAVAVGTWRTAMLLSSIHTRIASLEKAVTALPCVEDRCIPPGTPRVGRAMVLASLAMVLAVMMAGCQHYGTARAPTVYAPPSVAASAPLTRAEVRGEAALGELERATAASPAIAPEPKAHVEAAAASIESQKDDLKAAREALAKADANANQVNQDFADLTKRYNALTEEWYVRWGIWLERMFWTVAVGWTVLGIASVFLGLGNPASWTFWIAKQIRLFLPGANLFSAARGWLEAGKVVTLSTKTPV